MILLSITSSLYSQSPPATLTNMSLPELPRFILRIILEYVPDPETLCNLDCVSREFHILVREDLVWKPRLQKHWRQGNRRSLAESSFSARDKFITRYNIDKDLTQCISRLTRTTEQLHMLYAFSHVMAKEKDALDVCWKLWKHHKNSDTRMFARGMLRMVHCGAVCSDLKAVFNNESDHRSPGERLEDACISTTSMFREMSSVEDKTAETIKQSLDDIANKIRSGITDGMSLTTKLQRVDSIFFHDPETGISGNTENYYDFRNSLLDVSLQRRRAIPMTLAIVYKSVCRRLDILVEIVGLPSHIVVHIPALDRFVDVFDGGRQLSMADCVHIVNNCGLAMQDSYLHPLPPDLVVKRILNNIENCLVLQSTEQRPVSARQRAAITAMRAIANDPSGAQLLECRHFLVLTFVSEACVGTDLSDW